ncbi:MAG: 23S rRNA (pseudouridine(1915)-N(3))-methyltransferase RlmH [Gammaproteobacteria bacterium]
MKISIIAVGKQMPSWVTTGYQDYVGRLPPEFKLQLTEITALKRHKGADLKRLIEREGAHMLTAIPPGSYTLALTERGQLWNTQQFAERLRHWQTEGQHLCLLIGGPEGLAPACLNQAHAQWSLSPLTFPHPLVRVLLAEQLYRAISILQQHPYHR